VWARVTPNQVTVFGTLLALANCLAFTAHQRPLVFGVLLIATELSDDLDGAVARRRGLVTRFGGYLDAVTDRYKESASILAVSYVTGLWLLGFVAITGSLLTSYNKARTAMETKIQNDAWPEPFERIERVVTLAAGSIAFGLWPTWSALGLHFLGWALLLLSVFAHLSALLRVRRAHGLLRGHPSADAARSGESNSATPSKLG